MYDIKEQYQLVQCSTAQHSAVELYIVMSLNIVVAWGTVWGTGKVHCTNTVPNKTSCIAQWTKLPEMHETLHYTVHTLKQCYIHAILFYEIKIVKLEAYMYIYL